WVLPQLSPVSRAEFCSLVVVVWSSRCGILDVLCDRRSPSPSDV
ncbi:unnamed protein product, partial [Arabidopsis halleri]